MRVTRPALCLAVAGSLLAGGAANAAARKPAPKPVCNLVTDPAGDGKATPAGGGNDAAIDIKSLDVASDKQNITGVLRLNKLSPKSSNAPTGMTWSISFTVDGTVFSMAGHASATGATTFDTAYQSKTGGSIYGAGTTGVFDTAHNEVRITAPLSLFAKQADIKLGTAITDINGSTGPEVLLPDATGVFGGGTVFSDSPWSSDTASGGKDYKGGTKSCVVVGK